jgi:Na+/H+ antiporter NhaD/arsenite permease-like protein
MPGATEFHVATDWALLWGLPFVGLLLTIAILPMVAGKHWPRHYPKWAAIWTAAFLLPAIVLHGPGAIIATLVATELHEYLPFILLLFALYVVTGGIHISGSPRPSAALNTGILAAGTLLAGVIGTIGAPLLLIRPLMRINRGRRNQAHLYAFFIPLVANIGGALSPLGNPPLLVGYLAGVPFLWPLKHLWAPTLVLSAGLLVTFFVVDGLMMRRPQPPPREVVEESAKFGVQGRINFVFLLLVIATVLIDDFWPTAPILHPDGVPWNVAELAGDLLYVVWALLSLAATPTRARELNDFDWEPIVEVAILFAAIFITLIPVIGIIAAGAHGPLAPLVHALMGDGKPDNLLFYGATGILSGFLDNTPTYLVFFHFAGGNPAVLTTTLAVTLGAISAAASYFGAISYLGNAPNLMVKSMAEAHGVRMPSFFAYTGFAILITGPWLALVALLFFR